MNRYQLLIAFILLCNAAFSQNEELAIKAALNNYMEGTSYNHIEKIDKAFFPEANLYLENKAKELWIVPIADYTSWFAKGTPGQFNNRIGNILSLEYYNSIAMAKAEILMPHRNLRFIDMFLLKKIDGAWKIISKSASSAQSNKKGDRILFIVSNAHYHGGSELATGNSFSEIVNAYDTFTNAGFTVDFVSPKGGSIPLAYINTSEELHKKYLYNPDFMYALKHTLKPTDVQPHTYKAVHYVGGGSAMYGVPENREIQRISMKIYEEHNGIISSVCHGTAGIVHLKTKDGKYLVEGKTISGYPDAYEKQDAAYFKQFPFLIQKTIEQRGGTFTYAPRNTSKVEVDGNIITGQNYISSKDVALKIIEKLSK